ncbi:MAG TPA: TPM domain-containing protein [Gemmatimonadales bacterium]|nr:TPM domain-containing protein [Gemmatimonadales bacterium]
MSRISRLARTAAAAGVFATGTTSATQQSQVPPVTGGVTRFVPPSPAPEGFIADVPGVLPAEARATINARIRALQDSGYGDIGIAIVPSIGEFPPFEVGLAIYRTWRIGRVDAIGSARRDLGVLILVVPKELAPDHRGQCWISTGTGAEGIITDAVSGRICAEDIVPFLKARDYGAALRAGVEAIAGRLHADQGLSDSSSSTAQAVTSPESAPSGRPRWWQLLGGATLLGAGLAGVPFWRRRRPRRCPRCGRPMHRLDEQADDAALDPSQRIEEHIRSVDYDVWSCECGGSVVLPYKAWFSSYHECPACHYRTAKVTRRVIKQPTYTAKGLAQDSTTCKACHATSTKEVVLPKRTPPSTSSSSGGVSSGSSGGSSSFGGSGSSSGGGGGSSY